MLRRLTTCLATALAAFFSNTAHAAAASPFESWAGIVIAGDFRGDSGAPAEVFDNARRDISNKLVELGFQPTNVLQYSVRPQRYAEMPLRSDFKVITETVKALTDRARGGCFFYLTSHGTPDGFLLDDRILPPSVFGEVVEDMCPGRPTVIFVSACYSGVFVPALMDDSRMIVTAARPDRPSFGCSEDLHYTFFDQCVLESFPKSPTLPDLAVNARACVAEREEKEGMEPPSEPQIFIGANLEPLLAFYRITPHAP